VPSLNSRLNPSSTGQSSAAKKIKKLLLVPNEPPLASLFKELSNSYLGAVVIFGRLINGRVNVKAPKTIVIGRS